MLQLDGVVWKAFLNSLSGQNSVEHAGSCTSRSLTNVAILYCCSSESPSEAGHEYITNSMLALNGHSCDDSQDRFAQTESQVMAGCASPVLLSRATPKYDNT